MPVENGRFQQTCRSIPNVVQQFVKFCHGECVRGEPCVRVADGAVGLSFMIPNGTFRPKHELLLLFPELDLLRGRRPSAPPMSDASRWTPTSRSRLARFSVQN